MQGVRISDGKNRGGAQIVQPLGNFFVDDFDHFENIGVQKKILGGPRKKSTNNFGPLLKYHWNLFFFNSHTLYALCNSPTNQSQSWGSR